MAVGSWERVPSRFKNTLITTAVDDLGSGDQHLLNAFVIAVDSLDVREGGTGGISNDSCGDLAFADCCKEPGAILGGITKLETFHSSPCMDISMVIGLPRFSECCRSIR